MGNYTPPTLATQIEFPGHDYYKRGLKYDAGIESILLSPDEFEGDDMLRIDVDVGDVDLAFALYEGEAEKLANDILGVMDSGNAVRLNFKNDEE